MKFKSIIVTVLLTMFLGASAFATPYSLNFDADGTGSAFSATEIWGFDTEGIAQYTVGGQETTTYIEQNLGSDGILGNGDTFDEKFTTIVKNGVYENGNTIYPTWATGTDDLKIDVSLSGYISGYDNGAGGDTTWATYYLIQDDSYYTNITAGSAKAYIDMNDNNIYDMGDTSVADFGFSTAAPSYLSETVWPGAGGSANYSVAFSLDSYNTDFWSDAGSSSTTLADLVEDGFVMTYNDGSAKALGIMGAPNTDPDTNTILLGFSDNGIDVTFGAVPEPTTMLLFGLGLLGLAGVSRKKFRADNIVFLVNNE